MKKEYIKPEMLVEEILIETMIATSPGEMELPEVDKDGPVATNEHRGSWGNLWD